MPEQQTLNTNMPAVEGPAIRMVIQRYRQAKLLIDDSRVVTVGRPCPSGLIVKNNDSDDASTDGNESPRSAGLLAYISFAKTATRPKVDQAAQTLLNLPVLTLGVWGDGSTTQSIYKLSSEVFQAQQQQQKQQGTSASLSVVLVPQANVTAKVKKLGKSIQYRGQIAKLEGEALYHYFVQRVDELLQDHLAVCRGDPSASSTSKSSTTTKPPSTVSTPSSVAASADPSVIPSELFRQAMHTKHGESHPVYGSFDSDGIFPLTYGNGESLTKSARKKLQKVYEAHVKKHAKYLAQGGTPTTSTIMATGESTSVESSSPPPPPSRHSIATDPSWVHLVAGSFGKRQGLELQSDLGPFCHVVEID